MASSSNSILYLSLDEWANEGNAIRRTWQSGLWGVQRVTVNNVGHLAAARRVVGDDAEVIDGATGQVVVHQTDGAVSTRRTTTATSFARRLEVNHVLPCTSPTSQHVYWLTDYLPVVKVVSKKWGGSLPLLLPSLLFPSSSSPFPFPLPSSEK